MSDLKLKFVPVNEEFKTWIASTRNNDFDPGILEYPTLRIICAYDGEPEAYLPTQLVVMLESLALKPGMDAHQYLEAVRTLVKGVTLNASSLNVKEIYFIASDPDVLKTALKHGFEPVKQPVLRMKL